MVCITSSRCSVLVHRPGSTWPLSPQAFCLHDDGKRRNTSKPGIRGDVDHGVGQGFTLTTPLQLASATATLATQGLRLQPQLVERIVDSVSATEQVNAPRIVGQIELTETRHWGEIIDAMVDSVHTKAGTAFRISKGMNYKMAGKTGTAQVFGIPQGEEYDAAKLEKKLRDHALFVAFCTA